MKILKSEYFHGFVYLTQFVNDNIIAKEDILIITQSDSLHYTLFFYGEAEVEEKKRNIWGNL